MKSSFLYFAVFLLTNCWALEVADVKDCPVIQSTGRATSIHNLKANDIEVIAALGDR